jgi:hypothetical protein
VLTDERIERYARHILLREVGGQGQRRLLEARVEVEGLTASAAWATHYLALGGVGSLLLRDDRPSPPEGLLPLVPAGAPGSRAEAAAAALSAFNPDVEVEIGPSGPGEPGLLQEGWCRWTLEEEPSRRLWSLARGQLGVVGWGEGLPPCGACIEQAPREPEPGGRGVFGDPEVAGPPPEVAALVGSLVASRIFEALLLDGKRDGPFFRLEGGAAVALPPCSHRDAEGAAEEKGRSLPQGRA